MSRLGFFNKVPGQSIFRKQQVDFLSCYVSLDAYCCHFLHSFSLQPVIYGGALCHGPTLGDPLQKSETDAKRRPIV